MTLDQAVEILNQRNHRGLSDWHQSGASDCNIWICSDDRYDALESFEAIAIAEKYANVSGWISVEERLPSQDTSVLCFDYHRQFVGQWRKIPADKESWITVGRPTDRPSHWQPLPPPPEAKS